MNQFADSAKQSNWFKFWTILAAFILMLGAMYAIVNLVIINAMQIHSDKYGAAILESFSAWDEMIPIETITLEMRQAVYQAKLRVITKLDIILTSTADKVYELVKIMFMFCYIFTFCVTAAVCRPFASTLDMQMANLGPASLEAVRGAIDEILTDQYKKGKNR